MDILDDPDKQFDWVFSFVALPRYNWAYNAIRERGVKLVIWYADMLDDQRRRAWGRMKGMFDVVICSSQATARTFDDMELPAVFVPQYFELEESFPLPPRLDVNQRTYEICFIGQIDKHREKLISRLRPDFDVITYGPRNSADAIFGHEMSKVYAQSKIGISMSRGAYVQPTGHFQTSNRIYRVMGSGCFLLDDERSCLSHRFENNKHYATFDGSASDLVEKVRYWLQHEDKREKIAAAGFKHVLANHTLEIRLHEYWEIMARWNMGSEDISKWQREDKHG